MPYTVTVATPEERAVVVDALRSAADQRTRVAKGAARQVAAAKAGGKDVRAQAVKVTAILAEADVLTDLADELAAATEVAVLSVDQRGRIEVAPIPEPPADTPPEDVDAGDPDEDDGTSPEAQRLAAAAGLTPAVEDPETGALPEDEPADSDVEDVNL